MGKANCREERGLYLGSGLGKVFYRLGKRLGSFWLSYRRHRQQARERNQLLNMDDRMLKDIGLSRSDVHRITRNNEVMGVSEQIDQRYRSCDGNE